MHHLLVKLFEAKTNASQMAILLVELLNVKISKETLTKEIEEHPNYPSLLSISDVLNDYGIRNIGIKIDQNKFAQIDEPFITQLRGIKSSLNSFTVVKQISEDTVLLFDPEAYKWNTIPIADFLKRYSGIILLTEPEEGAGEKNYKQNLKKENRNRLTRYLTALSLPMLVIIAGLVSYLQNGSNALLPFAFSIITLIGSGIGALLLWYEVDQHNPTLKQICSVGKKVNCSAILQAKVAKIAGISWSAIGSSYFLGLLLLLLFEGFMNSKALFITAWINATSVPYIFFSIYYQWRVAKQWCLLCLSVQGLLLLQLSIAFIGGWHTLIPATTIKPEFIVQAIAVFTIPFLTIIILLPVLQKAKESRQSNIELQRLKHNPQVFEALLQKQKMMIESADGLGITLGNPDAPYKLIKVCNPYCGPCARAHKPMEDLLHNNANVQIKVLFTATNNEADIKMPPVKHLLAIAEHNEESVVRQALDDWYLAENKDYQQFAVKYPMNGELKQQGSKIEAMQNWCDKVRIDYTPTFFISLPSTEKEGESKFYQLPSMYSVSDLKYFFSV